MFYFKSFTRHKKTLKNTKVGNTKERQMRQQIPSDKYIPIYEYVHVFVQPTYICLTFTIGSYQHSECMESIRMCMLFES